MPARRCPNCSLVNPGSAMVCDCGYSFVYDEPPRNEPGKPWAERQSASTLRLVVRLGMALLFGLFVVAIRLCGT